MASKILFVDDEPPILDGYKRLLYREFEVHTAVGGEQALETMGTAGPFAVVISDMRMPIMNGAQFLAKVRETAAETVRMLLTGHTDLNAAIEAVNEGNIFRFLTKPCEKDVLAKAINAGVAQYQLVTAERDLLENTLMGSIKVMTEVLSTTSPEAFGKSMRIAHLVRHLLRKFNLPSPWRFEAAALLSQLGCFTLAPELITSAYLGAKLSPDDLTKFAAHPLAASEILVHIPRLESVAWMISQQLTDENQQKANEESSKPTADVCFGAKMLKIAIAFDNLKMKRFGTKAAIDALRVRSAEFGPELVEALEGVQLEIANTELRKVLTVKLAPGMILQQEVRTKKGMLMVTKGQEITQALQIKLGNFSKAGAIAEEIEVLVPV
jgi:FixJ family two-component response regulator